MDEMLELIGKLIENLNQFVDLLKSNLLAVSISLAIFSGLILMLPESLFSRIYLVDLRQNYLPILGAVAFISCFLTILLILYRLLAVFYLYSRGSLFELPRLTQEECSRLNHFIQNKSLTETFNTTDGVIYMLQDKGLIYKAQSKEVTVHYEQDFHIYRWIYSKLISHPEIITRKISNDKGKSNEE
jgi:hypothetical protein